MATKGDQRNGSTMAKAASSIMSRPASRVMIKEKGWVELEGELILEITRKNKAPLKKSGALMIACFSMFQCPVADRLDLVRLNKRLLEIIPRVAAGCFAGTLYLPAGTEFPVIRRLVAERHVGLDSWEEGSSGEVGDLTQRIFVREGKGIVAYTASNGATFISPWV